MSDTHTAHETGKWSERAKIGFLMLSTAITALAYVNMSAYRDAVERNTEEVRRLKEDRDHDYRETMTWRLTGWVQRSRTQDRNLGLYRNRFIEIEAYCRRNPCNLPDRLFAPVTIEDTQSTEALLLASEQITQDAPYGTRDDKEK